MPVITLKFVGDGDGVFPDLAKDMASDSGRIIHVTSPIQVSALRGGMSSGKTSVMLRIDLPDGHVVLAETSAALFCAVANGIDAWERGAS